MKQIRASIINGTVSINSREIEEIVSNSNYFEEVRDISDHVYDDDVFAYEVKLDQSILETEIEHDLEEEGYMSDDEEEYTSALLEQAEYFIDAAVDEVKDRIEERYHLENIGSAYDIYQGTRGTDHIHFVMTLSFGATHHGQLYQLTNAIIDKNYTRNTEGWQ
ncbi:hypothetical protein HNQ80_002834 [Anaerosolibacter carboniphilus]|uniref:Uncharacterized protein n=1 Tax=Anaerosolibacter carboniphilus TaxID=1417629 RepID=A0A841KXK4_9FIRM|nr:hypothetical protein [Anaerosolibacter carboniphilus]MBB6216730.1 hypothetical protein [Anaerosolibacter carboniphilus]